MVKTDTMLIAALVIIAAVAFALLYSVNGPGWDLVAHYLNGRSLSNPAFYTCLLSFQCNTLNQNVLFYFESYRAPIAGFAMAAIYLFVGSNATIIVYIAILFAAYVLAIRFLAKKIEMDSLLLFALMLSPYLLYMTIQPGSEEMVSIIFLLVGLGFLARRSPWFGLFLGLATLGKYPTLILVPMILLLVKPKKIIYASILFVAAVLPWLVFNQVFFMGGPFTSYQLSEMIAGNNAGPFSISAPAYLFVLSYPIVFVIAGFALTYGNRKAVVKSAKKLLERARPLAKLYNDDKLYLYSILAVFFVLSVIATLLIGPYYNMFTQARYGYLLGTSAAIIVAVALNNMKKYSRINLPATAAVLSMILLIVSMYVVWQTSLSPYKLNIYSSMFGNAASELSSLGYGNCDIMTNDWMFMLYDNVKAFSQFDINPNVTKYPIVVFHNWTSATDTPVLTNLTRYAKLIYSSQNFSILVPPNYKCYN